MARRRTPRTFSSLDDLRLVQLDRLANLKSFREAWLYFRPAIEKRLGTSPDGNSVFLLGQHLSEVFFSNTPAGSSQSDLAKSGTVWESLICWYFNLVFWGTNVIAMRPKKGLVPEVLSDATSVTVSNIKTNKETDLIVFSVDIASLSTPFTIESLSDMIRANPTATSFTVVQCKTNWNDNAQAPMLWDIVYMSDISIPGIGVGQNGVVPKSFNPFRYAFATVPTNRKAVYTSKSTPVARLQRLSGGKYWGKPSSSGVCQSLSEFFNYNFADSFKPSVQLHVDSMLTADAGLMSRFLNLSF